VLGTMLLAVDDGAVKASEEELESVAENELAGA
jgi:hypothetical protein